MTRALCLACLACLACTPAPRPSPPPPVAWREPASSSPQVRYVAPAPLPPDPRAVADPSSVRYALEHRALKEGAMTPGEAARSAAAETVWRAEDRRYQGTKAAAAPAGSPNPPKLVQTTGWNGSSWPAVPWAPDAWR